MCHLCRVIWLVACWRHWLMAQCPLVLTIMSLVFRMCCKWIIFHSHPLCCCFRSLPALIEHWSKQCLQRSCTATLAFISLMTLQKHCCTHTISVTSSSHHFLIISQPTLFWWQILHISFCSSSHNTHTALLSPKCIVFVLCHMNYVCSFPSPITKLVSFSPSGSFLSRYYRRLTEPERGCGLIDGCCDVQSALNFRHLIPIRP